MISKEKDSVQGQIDALEAALRRSSTVCDRKRLERELAQSRAGLRAEQEAAYLIDFGLRSNPNWAVIHDLRIESTGRVAQMDHVLIDRFLEIYVVESKSFRTKIRYAHGGWERLNFDSWEGIPSPVEQNKRHIAVLQELIIDRALAPKRMGIPLRPTYINVVVVQPSCSVVEPIPKVFQIYRMDSLLTKIRAQNPPATSILKMIGSEALEHFAARLVECHSPAPERQAGAFNAMAAGPAPSPNGPKAADCQCCGKSLTSAEARYCRLHVAEFANQLLCRRCQSYAGNGGEAKRKDRLQAGVTSSEIVARCAICGGDVDRKVAAFCRFQSKRFEGRILCRRCQQAAH